MSTYIVTISVIVIISILSSIYKTSKNKKKVPIFGVLIIILILSVVAGLRWGVGTDYSTYRSNYSFYKENIIESFLNFEEPGIRIISYISSVIYDDFATMFLIASIITVGLSVWTIYKYSNYFSISILLYIFVGAWHGSFNGIRQYLACAILFAGHHYIIERKFSKYLIIIIIASLFHISALIMILLYFIPRDTLNYKQLLALFVIVILSLSLYDFIFAIINNVLVSTGSNSIVAIGEYLTEELSILRILVMIAPSILYLIITPKSKLNSEDNFYINMLFINAIVYIISMNSAYLARFTIYTNIYVALGFPKIFKGVDKKLSVIIIYIALILYLLFWGYEIMITPNLYNFHWIFER